MNLRSVRFDVCNVALLARQSSPGHRERLALIRRDKHMNRYRQLGAFPENPSELAALQRPGVPTGILGDGDPAMLEVADRSTLTSMGKVVDKQNASDPLVRNIAGNVDRSAALRAACNLDFEGQARPGGHAEPLPRAWRPKVEVQGWRVDTCCS